MNKLLVFTVTNDLSYDQRMIRICSSLAEKYPVLLVGRKSKDSISLVEQKFRQHRISCFLNKGLLGYIEFNIRLFFFLLFKKIRLVCAIDLDTIIPVFFASVLKQVPRVYDAHELFCEMKEVATRPIIYKCWKTIEKIFVPRFKNGYTVNQPIAEEFNRMYKLEYAVIKNVPVLNESDLLLKNDKYILYQGAVNEGRSFETLIPAMRLVSSKLVICGDGNFMQQVRQLVKDNKVEDKVIFKGKLPPGQLRQVTREAYIGITLFDKAGRSNYFSLANRFFDYMHAGVPQVCVNYPVYKQIVEQYPFALLIDDIQPESIAAAINTLIYDANKYKLLQNECVKARKIFNWQQEEKILFNYYRKIFDEAR